MFLLLLDVEERFLKVRETAGGAVGRDRRDGAPEFYAGQFTFFSGKHPQCCSQVCRELRIDI